MRVDLPFYWREFQWKMYDVATILFDDSKNDLRALPKTVRLQLLMSLSFVWSTAFSVTVFETMNGMTYGWGSLVIGHLLVILAAYYTFQSFKNIRSDHKQSAKGNLHSWDECIDFLKKKDGD
tara:strand:- start:73 stop:438 length:366 start_codon:yes stop_codon:yes gene_type:complete